MWGAIYFAVLLINCYNVVRTSPTDNSASCTLPNHPEFGKWSFYNSTLKLNPGDYVPPSTIIQIKCDENHKLDGAPTILCIEGEWTSTVGQCLKTCPALHSTSTMTVECTSIDKKLENCTNAVHGTLARFKCANFYEDLSLARHPVQICKDGTWSHPLPNCFPVCGRKPVEPTSLIGETVKKLEHPWQAALYLKKNKDLLCGATIIAPNAVLTAAHCVTTLGGKLISKENYVVAVGKYYRKFDDRRDQNDAQFSNVKAMHIPKMYMGEIQNYVGDIAVIITETSFSLSERVQPACVDWASSIIDDDNKLGYVTGWGLTTENEKPSETLKEIKVSSLSSSKCKQQLPEDYQPYLTHDKMCAGYVDKGISVCRGDSGGGLVYKQEGRYYITGIVGLSPQDHSERCSNTHTLFTKVSTHIEFILRAM